MRSKTSAPRFAGTPFRRHFWLWQFHAWNLNIYARSSLQMVHRRHYATVTIFIHILPFPASVYKSECHKLHLNNLLFGFGFFFLFAFCLTDFVSCEHKQFILGGNSILISNAQSYTRIKDSIWLRLVADIFAIANWIGSIFRKREMFYYIGKKAPSFWDGGYIDVFV